MGVISSVVWIFLSLLYFALEFWKEKVFARLRNAFDPSSASEDFDFEAMSKWIVFEQVFDLVCLLLMIVPAWLSTASCWKSLLFFSLPRLRKKGLLIRGFYISFEKGYRLANVVRSGLEKNVVMVLSHGLVLACLVFAMSDHLIGFLVMRQLSALLQSLYTLSGMESRKVFTTIVNVFQLLVIFLNLHVFDYWFSAMTAIYVYQLGKPLVGFYLK